MLELLSLTLHLEGTSDQNLPRRDKIKYIKHFNIEVQWDPMSPNFSNVNLPRQQVPTASFCRQLYQNVQEIWWNCLWVNLIELDWSTLALYIHACYKIVRIVFYINLNAKNPHSLHIMSTAPNISVQQRSLINAGQVYTQGDVSTKNSQIILCFPLLR